MSRADCPPELLGRAAALGLTAHAIPTAYGGGGVAAVTSSLIARPPRAAEATSTSSTVRSARPQVAASAIGIGRAAFEYATDYANDRRAFGKPLIAKQGVSFKLADMAMQVEAARPLVWCAAAALDAGEDAALLGSYARAFAADAIE